MDDAARAQEMWTQFAGKNLEMLAVWAEANQRIMSDWVDFTSGAAKEGLRLYGELQVKALEGMKTWATLTDAVVKTKEIYARAA